MAQRRNPWSPADAYNAYYGQPYDVDRVSYGINGGPIAPYGGRGPQDAAPDVRAAQTKPLPAGTPEGQPVNIHEIPFGQAAFALRSPVAPPPLPFGPPPHPEIPLDPASLGLDPRTFDPGTTIANPHQRGGWNRPGPIGQAAGPWGNIVGHENSTRPAPSPRSLYDYGAAASPNRRGI